MILNFPRMIGVAAAMLLATATMAQEDSSNRVSASTDWSVFVESDPNECWAVSAPKETLNTRDGNTVDVRRGDIRLIVFYRPGENVNGQVMFTGGYPFATDSTVSVQIGDANFQMFTQGETAWPATPEEDVNFVAAMKRGANAVLTARSGRGTQTQDTFSLLGFTASVDEAANRCAG